MLLHMIKGTTSFQKIKTIDGRVSQTYREVCLKMINNGRMHWQKHLKCHAHQIRNLFAIILTTCALSDPKDLWDKHKESMSGDIFLRARRHHPRLDIQYSGDIFNEALIALEHICMSI